MRPVETAEIARAIANIATAKGVASSLPMVDDLKSLFTKMFQDQLRQHNVNIVVNETNEEALAEELRPRVLAILDEAQKSLTDAALPRRFYGKMTRIRATVLEEQFDGCSAKARLDELMHDLVAELAEPMFLHIGPERRPLYEQTEPLFGSVVETKFADASQDIASAGRCLALDEWTACVFHLMRVLEHGLRLMAQRFGVPFQVDSWHKVIKEIEDGITALRNTNKPGGLTQRDREEITHYSDAASQFRHFKDAWRNHVSHARATYDEREAQKVWDHTKEFMTTLAVFV